MSPSDDDGNDNPNPVNEAQSTGKFSSPNAALYSLNDSRSRAFPRVINTPFEGNGHSETWDGRVFVAKRTGGWYAQAFRPERIERNSDGSIDFTRQNAFGNRVTLELESDAPGGNLNWLAIVPDSAVSGENPYPSDAAGRFSTSGSYSTYKAIVYHTIQRDGHSRNMGYRTATFIVSNANTRDAQVSSAELTSSFRSLRLQSGAQFMCIEPSVTLDGMLIVCQGHPEDPGRIDNLVYSWNPVANATASWRTPNSIANMYWDDRNQTVGGMPFRTRFPIAESPLLDAAGNEYRRNDLVKGAYPWISHDGSELFYQASREGVNARRTATTVVGRWTGGVFRHIDGPINPYRHVRNRLFVSSPGAFTTMWTPYKDVDDLKIPYSVRGPSYPVFGSNSRDYTEVGFDDYLDGNFVLYFGMNEQIDRDGGYQRTRTPDTSGNFNNGTLVGAKFPLEYNNRDEIVGRFGQAIYFGNGQYVEVAKNRGWDTLDKGFTVDFWVRKMNGSGTVRLFNLNGGIEISLLNGSTLSATVTDTANTRLSLNGSSIATNSWTHVALTVDSASSQMQLYVDGRMVASRSTSNFGSVRTSGSLRVGPESSNALLILDEVKVSNVARTAYEIGHYANVRTNKAANSALMNSIPSHLSDLRFNVTGVDNFSSAAADLGEELFNDVILSRQRTTSCATCHNPTQAFTDGLPIAQGNEPTDAGVRNTPMLLNRLFSSMQGWSGLDETLDVQALTPIQASHEMNLPMTEAVQRLRANSSYNSRFQQVFGQAPSADTIAQALASFQAVQFAPRTRVDSFLAGNASALNPAEKRGLDLFQNKARCAGCHAGDNFTDETFRHNGLTTDSDPGRAEVSGRDRDFQLFKVPSLRELVSTAPYMHNGSLGSLEAVVSAYNDGGFGDPMADTDIRPLRLTSAERDDLVAFLRALSAD
ncbi:cytochrome c peroxidase [Allohahella marinimesophila]|uniref:Cytochrome c domain-containing protein n=1 Tax=Allohahella marinimesophila TaxID=1054972 RepID=A0ABP7NYS8_9GAMM